MRDKKWEKLLPLFISFWKEWREGSKPVSRLGVQIGGRVNITRQCQLGGEKAQKIEYIGKTSLNRYGCRFHSRSLCCSKFRRLLAPRFPGSSSCCCVPARGFTCSLEHTPRPQKLWKLLLGVVSFSLGPNVPVVAVVLRLAFGWGALPGLPPDWYINPLPVFEGRQALLLSALSSLSSSAPRLPVGSNVSVCLVMQFKALPTWNPEFSEFLLAEPWKCFKMSPASGGWATVIHSLFCSLPT